MKKTIKLAVVAALALGTTSAFATNGSNLIGMGAKTRGMAGTGIGMSHGAESALVNPALITSVKGTEISFGGTLFMPNVKNTNDLGAGGVSADSDAKMNVIPEVSLATKVNDNFYWGVGMWGTAGMGTDYRSSKDIASGGTQMQMVTNLQLMQFGVPLAYTMEGVSVAITPVLQYGALDINYNSTGLPGGDKVGAGIAQDLKFGYNLGLSYQTSGITIGATYKSQIDMEYQGQLSNAMQAFGLTGYTNDKLSTPAEIGAGVSYAFDGNTIAIDFKQIQWSKAKGYEDFKWDDQNVISVGYEYATADWAARIGYNYAKSPISEQSGFAGSLTAPSSGLINTFNLLGFPAIVESHYAIGGTYNFSTTTSLDLAFTYAPEVSNTYTNFTTVTDITTKHSQTSASAQLNYAF
ncbi:outer membrane protein transport protein [Sulfurimonas sp. HSL3-2]|uniref:OmpP1/FadL family transporter n=1 Tax=Hydrocurvibacter mobilis TaxID=3131936 RepID=UPI0031F86F5D